MIIRQEEEMSNNVQLFNGDCFEVMKTIPNHSIDFVLTDPPYEFKNFNGGGGELGKRQFKDELKNNPLFDKVFEAEPLMKEIERLCKKVNCVIFGTDPMMSKLMQYAEKHDYIYTLTLWHKTNPPPFLNGNYLKDIEFAICIREKGVNFYGDYYSLSKVYTSEINMADKKKYNHPTIKPVSLITKYILNHSKQGDTVLDMYMGSGTTGVASVKDNRNFIGIELNKTYFETAKTRIEEANAQGSLF